MSNIGKNLNDFNAEFKDHFHKVLCDLYNLETLIKEPTCFENPENPTCIKLMLTNSYKSFQKSCAIEMG